MTQSPSPSRFGCLNKAGLLPSLGVMLSRKLKQYYEPLRLPLRPNAISFPYTHQSVASPPPQWVSRAARYILHNMPPLPPRESLPPLPLFQRQPTAFPFRPEGRLLHSVLRGYIQVRLRCGLLLCPWKTYDIQLLRRRFPVLKRRTDNSFRGTSTRWIYRRSRRTVCPLLLGVITIIRWAEG